MVFTPQVQTCYQAGVHRVCSRWAWQGGAPGGAAQEEAGTSGASTCSGWVRSYLHDCKRERGFRKCETDAEPLRISGAKGQGWNSLQETNLPRFIGETREGLFQNFRREEMDKDDLKLVHPGAVICER